MTREQIISGAVVTLIATFVGWLTNRASNKASVTNVTGSNRVEMEKEAYERARKLDTETIARQEKDHEKLEGKYNKLLEDHEVLREKNEQLDQDVARVTLDNYQLHRENTRVIEMNEQILAENFRLRRQGELLMNEVLQLRGHVIIDHGQLAIETEQT